MVTSTGQILIIIVLILLNSFSVLFQMIRPSSHKIKLLMMLKTILSLMTVLRNIFEITVNTFNLNLSKVIHKNML